MKFPAFVYRCPGSHHCEGNTYDYLPVSDDKSLKTALSNGWFETLPEAMSGKAKKVSHTARVEPVPADDEAPTRNEMETQAKMLGVSFNARTTDEALLARIDEALAS